MIPSNATIVHGYRLFGARNGAKDHGFFISSTKISNSEIRLYLDYRNSSFSSPTYTLDHDIHVYDFDKNIFKLDDVIIKEFTYDSFTTQYNALLFGGNSDDSITTRSWKIYYCRLYDNGVLIHNFIPAYHKTSGIYGMYDTVSEEFYTNQGTGTFEKGDNVLISESSMITGNAVVSKKSNHTLKAIWEANS